MIREHKEKEEIEETPIAESENKGRQLEEDYFFPDKRVTIKASSLNEAIKKLKELK